MATAAFRSCKMRTGKGEPLLQPHLVQWVDDAHAAGREIGLLTNALLPDEIKVKALIF